MKLINVCVFFSLTLLNFFRVEQRLKTIENLSKNLIEFIRQFQVRSDFISKSNVFILFFFCRIKMHYRAICQHVIHRMEYNRLIYQLNRFSSMDRY